ncbi:MAG: acyltransferase family protein [Candidatus Nanopelagicales bacterium]|nr:acyltransferase family protein [Candidatus Nanopelagicales bacterium]
MPTTAISRSYRPDIQGLRAIAVVMVLLFHAGLPFPGGFLGVDVFFVISGFVITSMLHRDKLQTGSLRLGQFYLRRFKRLTPALVLTVVVAVLASAVVLSPLGAQQTAAATGIGALLLVANVVIDRSTGNYFALPAETNPLLNTWTLSVEEQFYLVFPALLMLGWFLARRYRIGRNAPIAIVSTLAGISFVLAIIGPSPTQNTFLQSLLGFYSPVTRAWEFAAGAILALVTLKDLRILPRVGAVAGLLGLIGLVATLWVIPSTARMPGVWTVLPVAATLMVIWAGMQSLNPVTRVLSMRPFTAVGDISYSLYLWHWPLIVFAVLLWPQTPYVATIAALASVIPSVLSYLLLENPIRRAKWTSPKTILLLGLVMTVPALVICAGVWGVASKYWKPKLDDGQVPAVFAGDVTDAARSAYLRAHSYPCTIDQLPDIHQTDITCLQSKPGKEVDLAILGDSHAWHLYTGLTQAMPESNIMVVYLHYWPTRATENAKLTFKQVAEMPSVKAALVTGYWKTQLGTADAVPFINTLSAGGKQVFVTDDVPAFPFDASACKYRTGFLVGATQCAFNATDYLNAYRNVPTLIQQITDAIPGVHLLRTARQFCTNDDCSMVQNGRLMYEDNNHLNLDGSRYVDQAIINDQVFRKSMGLPAQA